MTKETDVLVVVMERGSEWPNCLQSFRRGIPNTVAIAQGADETPAALARRLERRLSALAREDRPVVAALMATSHECGAPRFESRCSMARALLSAFDARADDQRLWLCAPAMATDAVRFHLLGMVQTLTQFVGSSRVEVSVRFDQPTSEAAPGSGVRTAVGVIDQVAS